MGVAVRNGEGGEGGGGKPEPILRLPPNPRLTEPPATPTLACQFYMLFLALHFVVSPYLEKCNLYFRPFISGGTAAEPLSAGCQAAEIWPPLCATWLRSPKPEGRKKAEFRNPKTETRCRGRFGFVSAFGLLSAFGFDPQSRAASLLTRLAALRVGFRFRRQHVQTPVCLAAESPCVSAPLRLCVGEAPFFRFTQPHPAAGKPAPPTRRFRAAVGPSSARSGRRGDSGLIMAEMGTPGATDP